MAEAVGTIRILVIDDHPLVREGMAALIANHADLRLVGEAADGAEGLAQFRLTRPDVTLMDVQLPNKSGVEAIIAIREEFPDARIIVLTTYAGDVLAQRALSAGAQAYMLKSVARQELADVIRAVYRGARRIDPAVAAGMRSHAGEPGLTAREIEVLTLVRRGNSNKQIGTSLSINEETVKWYLKNILAKLGANDRTHAVTLGVERGILPP